MIPTILWHQTPKHVHLLIDLKNITKEKIGIAKHNLTFSAYSSQKDYDITFELSNEVIPEESAYTINENNAKIILTKKDISEWISLQKDKNLFKNNIKVNWDLWETEDDDEDLDQNMNSMMHQMGAMTGLNDIGPYGDLQDDDCEDDCQESNCCKESNCCDMENCCKESNCCDMENCCKESNCCDMENCCKESNWCDMENCYKESNCCENKKDCKACCS